MSPIDSSKDQTLDQLKYLWDEYKYRHELCWNAVFKATVSVVVLGVIPYSNLSIAKVLRSWILVPPVLSCILVLFSLWVVWNEIDIWKPVKSAYTSLQRDYTLGMNLTDLLSNELNEQFRKARRGKTLFPWIVLGFMLILLVLSIGNCFLLCHYLDCLVSQAKG